MAGENGRYRDFDAFFDEQDREPLVIKVFGEEYNLPPKLPAIVAVKAVRLQKKMDSNANVPESDLLNIAQAIFGEEVFLELCNKGLDVEQLSEIIAWVVEQYTGLNPEQQEEAADIKKLASTSSETGR